MTKKPLSEAEVQAMIASDPDAPEATDAQLAQAKPFTEAFPALAEKMRKSAGGRPKAANPKVAISLRLDPEVVARFKADGPGWQTRMNEALRHAAGLS
ncbi:MULTISPECIES: BrnA antitoxin family protein [Roseobacteraceae]|uniref:BrnA antitoxin family protein n=1 Tax=Roseobacteraceae TaxID=2854170 RepID=UPI001944E36B|nr:MULTISPECIES: BrnA antitoxin family protein [unclassified Salipiger]